MKAKDLNSKITNISNMKTIKIRQKTHEKLRLYQIKNKLETIDKAIEKLLK